MISSIDIMHPDDRKALQMLHEIPFIDSLCRSIMEIGYERLYRGENLATMVKVSSHSMPRIFHLMKATCHRIGLFMPDVYIYNDPVMNAYTYGESSPFVCISSSSIEKLDDMELMCLMAHECGHILCKHVLYDSVVHVLNELGEKLGIITYSLSGLVYLSLQYWSRRSEFSADRCAAAIMGEETFQRMTMKMACGLSEIGGDSYQLVRQAREYYGHENNSLWNKIQQNCRMAFYSHPQMVNRAYEIDRWKDSYMYKKLRSEI